MRFGHVSRVVIAIVALALSGNVKAQSIFTYAGGGSVDGRPATTLPLDQPEGVAVDGDGNLYIAEPTFHRVRRVDLATGVMTTVAGVAASGFSGDGSAASRAVLSEPQDVAVDREGNLFIADSNNQRIRRVDKQTGIITTVGGNGTFGFSGDNGAATRASLNYPSSVAVDGSGTIFLNDSRNRRIRIISSSGVIRTFAGSGGTGDSGDGGPATLAQLNRPEGIAVDSLGNLLIADYGNNRVRRVDRGSGIISTIAGNGTFGFAGDGGPATLAALHGVVDIWVDTAGDLLIAEANGNRIRKVDHLTGVIRTIAGGKCCDRNDGIPATSAHMGVRAVVSDATGTLFITDVNTSALLTTTNGRIRSVDARTGLIDTVAGVQYSSEVFNGDGGPASLAILDTGGPHSTSRLGGVALDSGGNLYISDTEASRIRRVDADTGTITTIAGGEGTNPGSSGLGAFPTGIAIDPAGAVFVVDTGYNSIRRVDPITGVITRYAGGGSTTGDGVPATRASLSFLSGLATDSSGNLFLVHGNRIRRIDKATSIITTIAGDPTNGFSGDGGPASQALFTAPRGLACDRAGNLFIADFGNHRIRRIDAVSGVITTVAGSSFGFAGDGGPATSAKLNGPIAVAVDDAGNLFIADHSNYRVRRVDAASKRISTYAGIGSVELRGAFSGDQGPARKAGLALPAGVAVTPDGDSYFLDSKANRVRVVYACRNVAPPTLSSPSDGSSGLSSVRLSWEEVRGAFRYDIYLDTSNPPTTIIAADIETTSFAPANLQPLTTYYWRIVAKGDPYCEPFRSATSVIRSFTTASECAAPEPFAK